MAACQPALTRWLRDPSLCLRTIRIPPARQRQAGIAPRATVDQLQAGRSQRRVLPGDLLFFCTDESDRISHIGIYAGRGHVIHASSSSGQVPQSQPQPTLLTTADGPVGMTLPGRRKSACHSARDSDQ